MACAGVWVALQPDTKVGALQEAAPTEMECMLERLVSPMLLWKFQEHNSSESVKASFVYKYRVVHALRVASSCWCAPNDQVLRRVRTLVVSSLPCCTLFFK